MRKQGGFTLIELLVVIAIVGILAGVVLVSINSARAKSRDARRVTELQQIQKALEAFYLDNGRYPYDNGYFYTSRGMGDPWTAPSGNAWAAGSLSELVPNYMPTLPLDPSNNKDPYYYYYEPVQWQVQYGIGCNDPCGYILSTYLENPPANLNNPACNGCQTGHNYCISGGGAWLNTSCFGPY